MTAPRARRRSALPSRRCSRRRRGRGVPALHPTTLRGTRVLLEPLAREHHDGLVAAARDGALWTPWYTSVPAPEGMRREIDRRRALRENGRDNLRSRMARHA